MSLRAIPTACLFLGACAADPAADDTGGLAAAGDPAALLADELATWLSGTFDSAEQAAEDPGYYAVQMTLCPVSLPELGERVLYIEQALADDLNAPYRQRFYRVEAIDDTAARSRIFSAGGSDESALVGLCADPSGLEALDIDRAAITERVGCDVRLSWTGDGFEGGTEGQACESSLGDAAYATAEVAVLADRITSWDRGWTDAGAQAWGAEEGPYVFVRR